MAVILKRSWSGAVRTVSVEVAREVSLGADRQRCTGPFHRNVFSHMPTGKVAEVARMLKAIQAQKDRRAGESKGKECAKESKRSFRFRGSTPTLFHIEIPTLIIMLYKRKAGTGFPTAQAPAANRSISFRNCQASVHSLTCPKGAKYFHAMSRPAGP
jgi:hypothetical protein